MAIIKDGLLSGRLGNKVYYVVDGKSCVRVYCKQKESNTYKQQVQRAKITAVTKFLSKFRTIFKIGYQDSNDKMSEFNQAIKFHYHNALNEISQPGGESPEFEIDINKVILSRGYIVKPEVIDCSRDGRQINLTWDNKLGELTNRYHDVIVMVAYTDGLKAVADFNVGTRQVGHGAMVLPPEFLKPVHLWVFYHNAQRSNEASKDYVSDSVYLGVR